MIEVILGEYYAPLLKFAGERKCERLGFLSW